MWCRPAEHLLVGADVEAGEVEEGQQVAVADVEEEVVAAGVVAVLEDLRQRELEQLLVEAHRALDVGAHQREVVQPAGRRGWPVGAFSQVRRLDVLALRVDGRAGRRGTSRLGCCSCNADHHPGGWLSRRRRPGDFPHAVAARAVAVSGGVLPAGAGRPPRRVARPVDARLGGAAAAAAIPARDSRCHTAYVPADALRRPARRASGGTVALVACCDEHALRPDILGIDDDGLPGASWASSSSEPVEDLRVDFEDGYGDRPADEEDGHARAAGAVWRAPQTRASGLRIKSFEPATRARALRTLDLLLVRGPGACLTGSS